MDHVDAIVILQTRKYTSGTYFPWDNWEYSTSTWWRYKIQACNLQTLKYHINFITLFSSCEHSQMVIFVNLILNQLSNDPQTANHNTHTYFTTKYSIYIIRKYSSRIWPITLRLKYLPMLNDFTSARCIASISFWYVNEIPTYKTKDHQIFVDKHNRQLFKSRILCQKHMK